MNRLFEKASRMLKDNRRRHGLLGLAAVVGAAVAVVCTALLMYPAHALTGGDALRNAINDDSAVFWRSAGAGDSAWSKTDGGSAVDADAELRLRVAFTLPAGTLANGTTLQYKVPSSVHPDTSAGAIEGEVYASPTVGDPSRNGANAIGTYSLDGDVLTFTFNEDVATANAGSAQGDGASDASADAGEKTASALNGYVDLDLGFDQLTCDDSGLATIELNDAVSLKVAKAEGETVSAQSADDSAATASVEATTDDEQDSAGVESMSLLAKAAPAANSTSSDYPPFDEYITSVSVEKQDANHQYTPATEFTSGDDVRAVFNFSILGTKITKGNNIFKYQIPNGLRPTGPIGFDTEKTLAAQDGTVYGTYTISKDGLILFTFKDNAISYTDTIEGTLNFTGWVSNDGDGKSSVISFPGNSKTITVKKKESGGGDTSNDVNVKKTATLSDDQKTITYKVTVSSKNGTSGQVNITDSLDRWNTHNAKPTYNESSISLQKFSAGSTTGQDVSSYIPQDKTSVFSNNNQSAWENGSYTAPSISLSDLPRLNAGESYELSYTVDLNATGENVSPTVNNSADARDDGGNKGQDNSSVHYEQAIKKSGTFRQEDDSIVWTIDVDPKGKDITSWSVTDTLPENTKLTKYVVRGDDGFTQTFDNISNPAQLNFSFANLSNLTVYQKKQAYHIDIYTDASAAQNGNVNNTATVKTDTDSIDVPATNPVYVNHRTTQVSKNHAKDEETQTKGIRKETWSSNITLPAGNLKTFTFTDTIDDAADSKGLTIDDSHYATAADLEAAFKSAVSGTSVTRQGGLYINVDNKAKYLYTGSYDAFGRSAAFYSTNNSGGNALSNDVNFSVSYFDKYGKPIPADDAEKHVKKFAVTVTIADGASVKALSMQTGEYPTYADTSKLAEGKSVTYKNNVAVGDDVKNSAKFDYTKPTQPKRIQKEVKTTDYSYSAGTGTNPVKFDLDSIKDGKLTYRITLTPAASDNGDIQIEDYLPEGMSYVDCSAKARANDGWNEDPTFTGDNAPKVSQEPQDDGSTKLTFTIPNYKYASNMPKIYLYYDVSIKSDPSWNNGSTSKTYNNTAKWGTSESTHSTKVDRNLEVVSKDGEQLYDSNNEPTNTLRYYVEINPGCKDLDPNSDELTLTDTLNSKGIDSDLDPSSIKLYAYDYSKTHYFDPERPIANYSATYDAKTHTITVKVPDKVACVLTYEYTLDNSFGTGATVSNNATLNGKNSTSKTVSLKEASSSGSVRLARLVLYKVDANDISKTLSGVRFTLSYWDGSQWVDKTTSKDLVTDKQGSISYDYKSNVDHLSPNTLYRLSEVDGTAPAGYAGGAEHFFIVKQVTGGTTSTDEDAFSDARASNATNKSGGTLTAADVDFFKDNKTSTMYVTNEYTRLTAKKAWTDENGVAKDAPSGASAKLALYRYTKKVDGDNSVNVTVTAKGNQDWSKETKLTGDRVSDGTVAIKKGSDFTFNVGGLWGGCSFDVYVNGQKYGDTQTFASNSPVSVTVSNITANTTIEVKQNLGNDVSLTEDSNNPWAEPPQILDDANGAQVGNPVDVSASNGWAANWDELPKQDDQGQDVYYAVKELSYTVNSKTYDAGTGSYNVSYTNNNGIQTGTVTVTNSDQGYELPSTGGAPSPLPWVGGTLAALAGVLLVRRMRPRRS